jgi:hypothetical protein
MTVRRGCKSVQVDGERFEDSRHFLATRRLPTVVAAVRKLAGLSRSEWWGRYPLPGSSRDAVAPRVSARIEDG